MPTECCFPGCPETPTRRDDGTHACPLHTHVHVATTGSWVEPNERNDLP